MFFGVGSDLEHGRFVGNAVPPLMAKGVGEHLVKHYKDLALSLNSRKKHTVF